MKTYLYKLMFMCLTLLALSCSDGYGHNASYNTTRPLSHNTNLSKVLYNLPYATWKQIMLSKWNKEQKTLDQQLNYIFEQIHKNPTNQTIIFYHYNLARALFNKPEIKSLALFQTEFDRAWWHDLVDQYNTGCPCVYLACLGTLPRIAMLIKQIHKNPMNEQIIFENYNIARQLYGKSAIDSIKQFNKAWWKALVTQFHQEHQRALEKNRTINTRLGYTAVYELVGLGLVTALTLLSFFIRPFPAIPATPAVPGDFLPHNFALSPAAGA